MFWPDADERLELSSGFTGIFERVVGILDIMEIEIARSSDPELEHNSFTGKQKAHTRKIIGVIGKHCGTAIIGMSVFLKEDRMTEKLGHAATCTCVVESIFQMVKEWLVMEDLKVMVLKFVLLKRLSRRCR